jgi:hypothetical protein
MEEPFLTFRKFNDPDMAADMVRKLEEYHIAVECEDSGKLFDPSFANNFLERDIRLKLKAADFERADGIMKAFYQEQALQVADDYYLFRLTDSELLNIVRNPDEWGYLDYALAQRILKEHGIGIPEEELKRFQDEKIKSLSIPEPADKSWTYLGYLLSLLVPPVGILIGLSMASLKKTLPDGQRLYAYGDADRRHGKGILTISIIFLMVWILIWLRRR